MSIPLTDAQFKKSLRKAMKVDREDLWKELHDIGVFFGLVGAISEALSLWRFAYSGPVSMPGEDDHTINVCGDGAISAVCYFLNLPDLSKGEPAPRYREEGVSVKRVGHLEGRVQAQDRLIRQNLTMDAWSPHCDWENLPPEAMANGMYRKARLLAQPQPGMAFSGKELESLSLLKKVLKDDELASTLHPYYRLEASVLAVDIATRHDLLEDGQELLRQWYNYSVEEDSDSTVESAFGLIPVAGLICKGVLSDKSKLLPTERAQLVETFVRELGDRLGKPEPAKMPKWKYNISVSHNQFYLEPLKGDPLAPYFQVAGESEQGFSSFPRQVAFGTPGGNTWDCLVEVEFGKELPSLKNVVQAVAVPLSVEDSVGLYLRNVGDGGNKRHIEVPEGQYDVVARFFPRKLKKTEGTCFVSWRTVLTFLPKGTIGVKCLKLDYGTPPELLIVHEK